VVIGTGSRNRHERNRAPDRRRKRHGYGRLLEHKLFPACRRCCKVELSQTAVPVPIAAPARRAIPLVPVS